MPLAIGIPRALHYYTFVPLWERFFYELGLKVVESGPTNKDIVDLGVRTTVTDACAPIKVFQGHAEWLARRTDLLFIPRMVSFEGGYVFCPKFLGLPDMLRATVDDLPRVIDTRFDLRKGPAALLRSLVRLGTELGAARLKALSAAVQAIRYFKQVGWTDHLRRDSETQRPERRLPVRIGVVGYPYIVHDPFLSCDMVPFVEKVGAEVVTIEDVSIRDIRSEDKNLSKQVFWHYSNRTLKAAYYLMRNQAVDGLVHATAFGCGPDAIVDKFLEIDCRHEFGVPFLSLTVDEHSGQAGVVTRLEAFLDMILRKKGVAVGKRPPGERRTLSLQKGDLEARRDGLGVSSDDSEAVEVRGRQVS
jgi:predicted nucleotide-binding protein (sugar kinase/HSP70/actin superfamily)